MDADAEIDAALEEARKELAAVREALLARHEALSALALREVTAIRALARDRPALDVETTRHPVLEGDLASAKLARIERERVAAESATGCDGCGC